MKPVKCWAIVRAGGYLLRSPIFRNALTFDTKREASAYLTDHYTVKFIQRCRVAKIEIREVKRKAK